MVSRTLKHGLVMRQIDCMWTSIIDGLFADLLVYMLLDSSMVEST